MTGDVLPCFDASNLVLPDDAACIVTVPTTLDVAANHGVVVAAKDGTDGENYSLCLVDNLLQKPTVHELVEGQAIRDDGRALLDTGIISARGKAWQELVRLAYSSSHVMIKELITGRKEVSKYFLTHCPIFHNRLSHLLQTCFIESRLCDYSENACVAFVVVGDIGLLRSNFP